MPHIDDLTGEFRSLNAETLLGALRQGQILVEIKQDKNFKSRYGTMKALVSQANLGVSYPEATYRIKVATFLGSEKVGPFRPVLETLSFSALKILAGVAKSHWARFVALMNGNIEAMTIEQLRKAAAECPKPSRKKGTGEMPLLKALEVLEGETGALAGLSSDKQKQFVAVLRRMLELLEASRSASPDSAASRRQPNAPYGESHTSEVNDTAPAMSTAHSQPQSGEKADDHGSESGSSDNSQTSAPGQGAAADVGKGDANQESSPDSLRPAA